MVGMECGEVWGELLTREQGVVNREQLRWGKLNVGLKCSEDLSGAEEDG